MIGLVVRLGILLAVVFAVVYGITRAVRASASSAAAKRIQKDITALKAGLEAGLYTTAEYNDLATRIRVACDEEGIEVPELPKFVEPNKRGES